MTTFLIPPGSRCHYSNSHKQDLWLLGSLLVWADESVEKVQQRLQSASEVLQELTSAPDKGIPEEVIKSAKCIAVIPHPLLRPVQVPDSCGRDVFWRDCLLARQRQRLNYRGCNQSQSFALLADTGAAVLHGEPRSHANRRFRLL
jgi:hypothetical protein